MTAFEQPVTVRIVQTSNIPFEELVDSAKHRWGTYHDNDMCDITTPAQLYEALQSVCQTVRMMLIEIRRRLGVIGETSLEADLIKVILRTQKFTRNNFVVRSL